MTIQLRCQWQEGIRRVKIWSKDVSWTKESEYEVLGVDSQEVKRMRPGWTKVRP